MRNLGHELGVEAMSLYNHVANKEAVLDGLVEVVVGEVLAAVDEIEPLSSAAEWKDVMRARILAAREVLLRHRWAPGVLESRTDIPPSLMPLLRLGARADARGGLLARPRTPRDARPRHAARSGSRGSCSSTDDKEIDPEVAALMLQQMAGRFPYLAELMRVVSHDAGSTLGSGCDDQFEFEFGLDLILDGLERLRDARVAPPRRLVTTS